MTSNLPKAAQGVLGPDVFPAPDGDWGGVPWMHGVANPVALEGLLDQRVTTFPYAPGRGVLVVTDSDNDLDGLGGSTKVDPDYERETALGDLHGRSCDSRAFPGVVISPTLAAKPFGVRLGDFCLVSWNGVIRSAQVYDIGPTRKAGENSLFLNRELGLVPVGKTDHWAALNGHDAQDVCTLIFARSGPGHALPVADIVAGAHACWRQFTGRPISSVPALAAAAEAAPLAATRGTAAGSVGVAVPRALALLSLLPLAQLPELHPNAVREWMEIFFWLMGGLLAVATLWKMSKGEKPLHIKQPLLVRLAQEFATKEELAKEVERVEAASVGRARINKERIDKIEVEQKGRHEENTQRLGEINKKIDRNLEVYTQRHESLARDVRHDVREELQAAANRDELRFQNQLDRITDIIRGLGRTEGQLEALGGHKG